MLVLDCQVSAIEALNNRLVLLIPPATLEQAPLGTGSIVVCPQLMW